MKLDKIYAKEEVRNNAGNLNNLSDGQNAGGGGNFLQRLLASLQLLLGVQPGLGQEDQSLHLLSLPHLGSIPLMRQPSHIRVDELQSQMGLPACHRCEMLPISTIIFW